MSCFAQRLANLQSEAIVFAIVRSLSPNHKAANFVGIARMIGWLQAAITCPTKAIQKRESTGNMKDGSNLTIQPIALIQIPVNILKNTR